MNDWMILYDIQGLHASLGVNPLKVYEPPAQIITEKNSRTGINLVKSKLPRSDIALLLLHRSFKILFITNFDDIRYCNSRGFASFRTEQLFPFNECEDIVGLIVFQLNRLQSSSPHTISRIYRRHRLTERLNTNHYHRSWSPTELLMEPFRYLHGRKTYTSSSTRYSTSEFKLSPQNDCVMYSASSQRHSRTDVRLSLSRLRLFYSPKGGFSNNT